MNSPHVMIDSASSDLMKELITHGARERLAQLSKERPCVLLVTHDSSRTGAPIIALKLARHFRAMGSVVTISIRSGPLDPHYRDASDLHLSIPHGFENPSLFARRLINRLVALKSFSFVVVNSVASWGIMSALKRLELPTLFLVHEYLSTTPEANCMPGWVWEHPFTVFPAPNVLENAIRTQPRLGLARHTVCVPGLCHEPPEPLSIEERADEDARVRAFIRPEKSEKAMVVLGVGSVCLRKGTDLFFMVASGLRKNHPEINWRFVWVGGGYDPENDPHFSRTLQDQLRHLGLDEHVVLAGEIDHVENALIEADLFFLSSRADPLPLVAQVAMNHALPVVCFDKTTGIADHLLSDPLTAPLVASYLDIPGAMERIADLASRPEHRHALGSRCRDIARRDFCFERYFNELNNIASTFIIKMKQLLDDQKFLLEEDVLNKDFLDYKDHPFDDHKKWVETYLQNWSGGAHLRKPFPGFHPGIYGENIDTGMRDPLCHWLQEGRPPGPWQIPVLQLEASAENLSFPISSPTPRTALHIHIFYPELIPDFVARLILNQSRPDLWLTIPEHLDPNRVLDAFAEYKGKIECQKVPNRGRDLGPLITALGRRMVESYDIVGHVHTKKSVWHGDVEFITRWREFLLENSLGGKHAMMDVVLEHMARDTGLGLIFPSTSAVCDWDAVQDKAQQMAHRMKIPFTIQNHLEFPVGSFFWARTRALQPWLELGLDWTDYPPEPVANGRTLLHALERLPAFVAQATGHRCALTYVPGFTW